MPAAKITPLKRALILHLAPLYTDGAIAQLLGEKANTVKWHRNNEPKLAAGLSAVDALSSFAIKQAIASAHLSSLTGAADALEQAATALRAQAKQLSNT
jgi:hypothetical protein